MLFFFFFLQVYFEYPNPCPFSSPGPLLSLLVPTPTPTPITIFRGIYTFSFISGPRAWGPERNQVGAYASSEDQWPVSFGKPGIVRAAIRFATKQPPSLEARTRRGHLIGSLVVPPG